MSDFLTKNQGFKVIALGGGTGLSTVLSGLKRFVGAGETEPFYLEKLSAIVAVSDDGGSSGRLRSEMQMPPPGDIRNCMVALSEDSHLLSKLFRHRFSGDGELSGHSFGNLFLAALTEITGDFAEAVKLSSEILASKGHIYPATNADVHLAAELEDGTIVKGETNISRSTKPIRQLKLEPENCDPLPEALAAIQEADIITMGPGSLYTSVLPPLLVRGVAEAIGESTAIKIFICNLMTQPGETDGYTSRQHLETVKKYAPGIDFDFIVMNDRAISGEQASRYAEEGAFQLGLHGSISPEFIYGVEIVRADLLDEGEQVRHHPEKLAQVLLACAAQKFSQVLV
ncbi:MAG TPA: YvcK family protein [Pyrinomonadaceae bacterium]|jgi:uncharacterized cofD-like protein|nr:YvcK family protein [Pyrinomonadaceae bacterium]